MIQIQWEAASEETPEKAGGLKTGVGIREREWIFIEPLDACRFVHVVCSGAKFVHDCQGKLRKCSFANVD